MKYNIFAVGNLKKCPEALIFENISKRLKNKLTMKEFVSKLPPGKARISDETNNLIKLITNNGKKILLDRSGKRLTSIEFAHLIQKLELESFNNINFIIGGPEGIDKAIAKNIDLTISFSNMTWPHLLSRVMLIEQIFRAEKINSGHPYHK